MKLSCLALAFGVAACGKAPDYGGKTVIRFLTKTDVGGYNKELIRRFEKKNPDIKIEMVEGPPATETREIMYASSLMDKDDAYDLIYLDQAWIPKFALQGWLAPLDGRFTPEERAKFLPGDIAGSSYEGRIYRVPTVTAGGLLYYRKDLLAAAGIKPPKTWAELLSAAKRLQKPPELWGFVFQGKQYEGVVCDFLELLWSNGGELLDGKGRVLIDSPEALTALRWLVDAVRKDKISPEGVLTYQEEEARQMFQEGKAVFMRNWPYAMNLMQADKSPVKGKVGVIPMVGGGGESASVLGGWGYGISAFSKHPNEAWRVIQFFASEESLKLQYAMNGSLPPRKALFSDPKLRAFYAVLKHARARPMIARYERVSDALQLHLSAALAGQEEPQAALTAAAGEIRAWLQR